jgi:hypothetical protein
VFATALKLRVIYLKPFPALFISHFISHFNTRRYFEREHPQPECHAVESCVDWALPEDPLERER